MYDNDKFKTIEPSPNKTQNNKTLLQSGVPLVVLRSGLVRLACVGGLRYTAP